MQGGLGGHLRYPPPSGHVPRSDAPRRDIEVAPHSYTPSPHAATRWHLEVPLKPLASTCSNVRELRTQLQELTAAAAPLEAEGWRLDGVFDGIMYLSASHVRRTSHLLASRGCFTSALAFGVLRELRSVRHRPVNCAAAPVRFISTIHTCKLNFKSGVCFSLEIGIAILRGLKTPECLFRKPSKHHRARATRVATGANGGGRGA
jgi:hypothetical protein